MHVLNVMATARDWHQEVGAPRPVRHAPWRDERPHMFVALREVAHARLQPGDLIRDIGTDDRFDGIAAIEIRLRRRAAPSAPLPTDG
jgi:hypothetical protein